MDVLKNDTLGWYGFLQGDYSTTDPGFQVKTNYTFVQRLACQKRRMLFPPPA